VLVKKGEVDDHPLQFMRPFNNDLWLAVFGLLLVSSVLFYVFEGLGREEDDFGETDGIPLLPRKALSPALYFAFHSFNMAGDRIIRSPYGRLYNFTFSFGISLLIASYTANLASFLVQSSQGQIKGLEDLAGQSSRVVVIQPGANTVLTASMKLAVYDGPSNSLPDMLRAIEEGDAVAIIHQHEQTALWVKDKDKACHLTAVGSYFGFSVQALMFAPGSPPHLAKINSQIISLWDSGWLEERTSHWIEGYEDHCSPTAIDPDGAFNVSNLWGLFALLGGTGVGCLVWFGLRMWWIHRREKHEGVIRAQRAERETLESAERVLDTRLSSTDVNVTAHYGKHRSDKEGWAEAHDAVWAQVPDAAPRQVARKPFDRLVV